MWANLQPIPHPICKRIFCLPHHSRAHIQRMVLPPAFERLCPFLFIVAYKPTRKLLNLDPLISHLTNSNECGNLQARFY